MQSDPHALQLLELVRELQPAGVGELARRSGLPKPTVRRTLAALADAGWLRRAGASSGHWVFGPQVVSLARARRELRDPARR